MKKTGFLHDCRYLDHDTGPYHPETHERLNAVYKGIEEGGYLDQLVPIKALPAEMKWIEMVHTKPYIHRFQDICASGQTMFDYPDNQLCDLTYQTAVLAAGGVIEAARMVMAGEIGNGFCAVRPPGHHAETDRALGFCYFNNVAIMARYLQKEWGLERVAIIDFDVHHGNGTQQIFEEDNTVFYFSIHEHPSFAFPGTGRDFEKGSRAGMGFTLNIPMLPGRGDLDYQDKLGSELIPAMEKFQPQFIITSTGFDAHVDDDMSSISLTTEGYVWIMQKMVMLAKQLCDGKLLSVLEGGYSLKRLPELARKQIEILLNA